MERGIHQFFAVCGFLLNRPETLPPLVDQRVTASKPVDHVFRKNHSPAPTNPIKASPMYAA
jgi:hypothetical protein